MLVHLHNFRNTECLNSCLLQPVPKSFQTLSFANQRIGIARGIGFNVQIDS